MRIQDSAEDSTSKICEQAGYTELNPFVHREEERGKNKAGFSSTESGADEGFS